MIFKRIALVVDTIENRLLAKYSRIILLVIVIVALCQLNAIKSNLIYLERSVREIGGISDSCSEINHNVEDIDRLIRSGTITVNTR